MIFLYDNLLATIVGGTVLLILFAMQTNLAQVNVQRTVTYMTKKQSLDFATWLEDDLLSIGQNMRQVDTPFEDPVVDTDGRTVNFTFYRDSLNTAVVPIDTTRIATRYVLSQVGTRTIGGKEVKLFKVNRQQCMKEMPDGAWSVWADDGSSPGLLKHFAVHMLDRNGTKLSDPATLEALYLDTVKQTHATFAMVAPIQTKENSLSAMNWGASILLRR